jgi:hypothetical protein
VTELPPAMSLLWLHCCLVGLATAIYAWQRGIGIGVALLVAALIAVSVIVLAASLSAMIVGISDANIGRSQASYLLRGATSVVYLLPFMLSQVAYSPIVCAIVLVSLRLFAALTVFDKAAKTELQRSVFAFNISSVFFVIAIAAIAIAQLLIFVKHKAF